MKFLKFSKYFAGFLAATLTFTSAMSAVDVISGNIAVAYADELDEGSETPSEEPATEISEPASESSGNEGGSSDNGGNGEEGNPEYSDPVSESEPAPTEDNEENTGSEETPAETSEETPTDVTDETEGTNPEASDETGEGVEIDETIDEPAGTEENPITDEEETPVEPTEKEPIVVNSLEDIPLEDIILGENGEAMVIRDEDGNPLTYNIVDPATGEIIQGDAPYTYGHFNDVVKEVKDSIEALTNCINEFKAQGGNMEDPYVKFIVGQKQAEIDAKIAELEETAELLKKQLEEEKAKKEEAKKQTVVSSPTVSPKATSSYISTPVVRSSTTPVSTSRSTSSYVTPSVSTSRVVTTPKTTVAATTKAITTPSVVKTTATPTSSITKTAKYTGDEDDYGVDSISSIPTIKAEPAIFEEEVSIGEEIEENEFYDPQWEMDEDVEALFAETYDAYEEQFVEQQNVSSPKANSSYSLKAKTKTLNKRAQGMKAAALIAGLATALLIGLYAYGVHMGFFSFNIKAIFRRRRTIADINNLINESM